MGRRPGQSRWRLGAGPHADPTHPASHPRPPSPTPASPQILNTLQVPYETVNILEDDRLRTGMKAYSQWPTFPQVYVGGEFYGGCDIMIAAYQSGELAEALEAALGE